MGRETGFPSPAQGYEAKEIDFNSLLIKNKAATFFMRMTGFFWEQRGIVEGDILVIDRSITPRSGMLIVFQSEGEFFCRELVQTAKGLFFRMQNDVEEPLLDDMLLFGVVTAVVRTL